MGAGSPACGAMPPSHAQGPAQPVPALCWRRHRRTCRCGCFDVVATHPWSLGTRRRMGSPTQPPWGCAPARALHSCPVVSGCSALPAVGCRQGTHPGAFPGTFQGVPIAQSPQPGEQSPAPRARTGLSRRMGRGGAAGSAAHCRGAAIPACPCSQKEGNQTGGDLAICASSPLTEQGWGIPARPGDPVTPCLPTGTGHPLG